MIYIFIAYYGVWPSYFQHYLDSLAINNDLLQVIMITDIPTENFALPNNIHLFEMSFSEIKIRAAEFLQEPQFEIPSHYKLCDFKIIYHILFADILERLQISETDHIGWGDIDLIYGKLSNFIPVLPSKNGIKFDLIGKQGHFTAFKNSPGFKSIYHDIDRLKIRLMDQRIMFVDENQGMDAIFKYIHANCLTFFPMHNFYCDVEHRIEELTMVLRPKEVIKYLFFDNKSLTINFMDGSVQECIYIHLQKRIMNIIRVNYRNYNKIAGFFITKNSFVTL